MDFSSLNPTTSNALNIAARENDVASVRRLLKKLNPSCIDNRGWTALHEAAAHDSYESMMLILKHKHCRPLAETHEGHTALYLACRCNASIKTIKALLDHERDIANYGSTEDVTPLHLACSMGKLDVIQLLLDYGAMINVQDFDGDTPLHDAALDSSKPEAVSILLHAGADPEIRNYGSFTAFHLACHRGCYEAIKIMLPFVADINEQTETWDTPLTMAIQGNCPDEVINFLLENGADPHIQNTSGDRALDVALFAGFSSIFKIILGVTNKETINKDIVFYACKPHLFRIDIVETLLNYDLGPEYFDFHETFYTECERIGDFTPGYELNAPLNSFLNICEYIFKNDQEKFKQMFYLFMLRGCSANALGVSECPPLVYIHYSAHKSCFYELFLQLLEFDCDVDYCSAEQCDRDRCLPDAFLASISSDTLTSLVMFQYSLYCEPHYFLIFVYKHNFWHRIPQFVIHETMMYIDEEYELNGLVAKRLSNSVLPLKHLCRVKIRSVLRNCGPRKTTREFLECLKCLPLPHAMQLYLRYKKLSYDL